MRRRLSVQDSTLPRRLKAWFLLRLRRQQLKKEA